MATIFGTVGADNRTGTATDDVIHGGPEANLASDTGADTLFGENGNDTLFGYGGNDSLLGGAGNDRLDGGAGRDTLDGGADNDTAVINAATLSGLGGGIPYGGLFYANGTTAVSFSNIEALDFTGNATNASYGGIFGGSGGDSLTGLAGADSFYGAAGNDTISGAGGNDSLDGGTGDNVIDGGTGADAAMFDFSDRSLAVNFLNGGVAGTVYAASVGGAAAGSVVNVESIGIVGGSGDDTIGGVYTGFSNFVVLTGNGGTDVAVVDASSLTTTALGGGVNYGAIYDNAGKRLVALDVEALHFTGNATSATYGGITGGTGNDRLTGLGGNDTFYGDTGNDTIDGATGNDSLTGGAGNDSLLGGEGNDSLYAGTGVNVVDGGAGTDAASFDFSDRSLAVNFLNGAVAGMVYTASVGGVAAGSIVNVESLAVSGGSAGDTIGGVYSVFSDVAFLTGGGGTDIAVVDASSLTTTALGGGVNYGAIYDNASKLLVALNVEALHFTGNATSANRGGITGGTGDDRLIGLGGNDTFYGDAGNDSIDGAAGNDSLSGGEGNDSLTGGSGNDTLDAGTGINVVDGGTGTDVATFDFSDRTVAVSFLYSGVATALQTATAGGVAAGTAINVETFGITGGSAGDTIGGVYSVFSDVAFLTGGGGTDIAVVDASSLTTTALGGGAGYSAIYDSAGKRLVGLDVEALHFTGNATNANYGGIYGGTGDDRLIGLGGNDTFYGDAGNDSIDGAAGNDSLIGGEGNDSLTGGTGNDTMAGDAGNDSLNGGDGNNSLAGGAGNDTLTGGSGNDTLDAGTGINVVDGGTGTDVATFDFSDRTVAISFLYSGVATALQTATAGGVAAGTAINVETFGVTGGSAGDTIGGVYSVFSDVAFLTGGGGTDIAVVDASSLTTTALGGGAGYSAIYDSAGKRLVGLDVEALHFTGNATNANYGGIYGGTGDDRLIGLGGNDTFYGDAGNDSIDGAAGNDSLIGGEGNDSLTGGTGNDTMAGDAGNDSLNGGDGNNSLAGGAGNDTLTGGSGNDTLDAGTGINVVDGGTGTDVATFDFSDRTVAISFLYSGVATALQTATAGGVAAGTAINVETFGVTGGSAGDTIGGVYSVFSDVAFLTGGGGTDIAVVDASSLTTTALGGGVNYGAIYDNAGKRLVGLDVEALHFTGNATNANYGGIYGGTGDDRLIGLGGNDTFYGDAGNDSIDGAAGNDSLIGGEGNDSLTGGTGNDTMAGDAGNDSLNGGDGNNSLAGGAGNDTLTGGSGNDTLDAGTGINVVDGGTGTDVATFDFSDRTVAISFLYSGVATALQTATAGGVAAGTAINVETFGVTGGSAGDTIGGVYSVFSDVAFLTGGGGTDIAVVDASSLTTTALGGGVNYGAIYDSAGKRLVGLDVEALHFTGNATSANWGGITGGTGNDRLIGLYGNDTFYGVTGNDSIDGAAGNDSLMGGDGNDTLSGGAGNDSLNGEGGIDTASYASSTLGVRVSLAVTTGQNTGGAGADTLAAIENLIGGSGADTLTGSNGANQLSGGDGDDVLQGGLGNDTLDGGAGNDTASYAASTTTIILSLADPAAQNTGAGTDSLIGIEHVIGGSAADAITGSDLANRLEGGLGNDTLSGGGGADTVLGGAGNDSLDGGADTDTLSYAGLTTSVSVTLAISGAQITGGGGTDTAVNFENLTGGEGADSLAGDGLANILDGGVGNDTLLGAGGADTLVGGLGSDSIEGGADADLVTYGFAVTAPVWTVNGDGSVTIAKPAGTDVLREVEVVRFLNGDYTVATNLFVNATLSIAALAADKAEGDTGSTPFTFTVTRAGDLSVGHSAGWTVAGDVSAADFAGGALPTGTVSFAAGEASKTITLDVAGDLLTELDESLTVTLSNGSFGTGFAVPAATGTIRNDDSTLDIAGPAAPIAEGNAGSTAFVFTVTRSGDLSDAASAAYAVTGASAADFVGGALSSGTVSFAAGETSKTISVAVLGDTVVEPDETFTLILSNGIGATLGTAAATATIRNDDTTLSIAALATDQAEGDAGITPFTFTITRDGDLSVAHSAAWTVTGGVSAADFAAGVPTSGSVSFAAGETSKTLTLDVLGDTVVEADEAFTVTLSDGSSGIAFAVAAATGTIRNDDTRLDLTGPAAAIAEGNTGSTAFVFTVTRDGDLSHATSAAYAVTGASAADFVGGALPSGTVSFAAGEASRTITLAVLGDTLVEPDETFTLTLSDTIGATLGTAAASATIRNDDTTLSIAGPLAAIKEGNAGSTAFVFTVTRSGDLGGAASAAYAVTGAGAADFVGGALPSGTVTFAAGESSKSITLAVAGDTVVEPDETFTLTLSNAVGATLGTAAATATIRNDDTTLSIAGPLAAIKEGDAGDKAFAFTVTRAGDTSGAASAAYAVTANGAGTAAASAADFTGNALPSGTVSFAAGETSKTITINVLGDTVVEAQEGFTVTLKTPTAALLDTASATAFIANDDAALALSTTSAQVTEGNAGSTPVTYTVTRTGDLSEVSTVQWSVAATGTSAAAATDFTGSRLPSGSLSFAAGESVKTFTVNIAGDTLQETNETFLVRLASQVNAVLLAGQSSLTTTIVNDDTTQSTLAIAGPAAPVAEGDSGSTAVTFTVTRSGSTTGTATVNYAVTGTGGNPASAADFAAGALPSGQVSFAAGETSKTITLNLAGDLAVEANEGFTVTLSAPVGATLSTPSATATIANDDTAIALADQTLVLAEGTGANSLVSVTLTRTGDLTGQATVLLTVAGSGAAPVNSADFLGGLPAPATVTFADGEASRTVVLTLAGDAVREADESFAVTLSAPTNATLGNALLSVTLSNDDTAGTAGADSLVGGAGNDLIQGLGGRDTLSGGEGADTIEGGLGADRLTGGAGADIFVYVAIAESTPALSGRDTIVDFSGVEGDRIDLSAIDADILVGGDQAFTLIEGDFTGEIGGELSIARFGSSYRVRLDIDGDGDEDAAITVISAQPLTASDFVL